MFSLKVMRSFLLKRCVVRVVCMGRVGSYES